MAFTKCSCSSILVAITKPPPKNRRRSSIKKHHAFCTQWAIDYSHQYKVKIESFYQEDDKFYFAIPYKQQQYLVDFDRFVNVSRKLSNYLHANAEFLELYDNESFLYRDISTLPFYYHTSTGIDISKKVVAELVNWINGADTDYRREDGRQAILVGHLDEYIQLFALALFYDIPALWNWCVKEVSCLPIEASNAHKAKRKYMDMADLVHDQEIYTYWPYTIPVGHYTRLPRPWDNEAPTAELSEPSLAGFSLPSSAGPSQSSSASAGLSQLSSAGLSQPSSAELSQLYTVGSSAELSQPSSAEISQPSSAELSNYSLAGPSQPSSVEPIISAKSILKGSTSKGSTSKGSTSKAGTRVTKLQSRPKQSSTAPRTRRRAPSKLQSNNNLVQPQRDLDGSSRPSQQVPELDSGYGTASPDYMARVRAMMEADGGSAGI